MVSGQDRSSSGAYPVFWAVAEFARSCVKSRHDDKIVGIFCLFGKKSAYKSLSKIALDIVLTI